LNERQPAGEEERPLGAEPHFEVVGDTGRVYVVWAFDPLTPRNSTARSSRQPNRAP
jgi:hypothetical protein